MNVSRLIRLFTYRPEDHAQWHGNVEIECITSRDARDQEQKGEKDIILETYISLLRAEFLRSHEAREGYEGYF